MDGPTRRYLPIRRIEAEKYDGKTEPYIHTITDMSDLLRVIKSKRALLFDLFHTLTALESSWSNGPMTHQLLGVSKEAWNEQLQEKSRSRLAGQIKEPISIIRTMAHAIDHHF